VELLGSLLPILAIFAIFYLLIIRPAKRRQQSVDRMQSTVAVGTEVATSGGLFGTIVSEEGDDRLRLEIAPGVVVTIARRAVAGVVEDAPAVEEDSPEELSESADHAVDERVDGPVAESGDEPGDDHRA